MAGSGCDREHVLQKDVVQTGRRNGEMAKRQEASMREEKTAGEETRHIMAQQANVSSQEKLPARAVLPPARSGVPLLDFGGKSFQIADSVLITAVLDCELTQTLSPLGDGLFDRVLCRVEKAVRDGANIVELGWAETRHRDERAAQSQLAPAAAYKKGGPAWQSEGATAAHQVEEMARLVCFLTERIETVLSVRTSSCVMARAVLEAGARLLCDPSGMSDPEMPDLLAKSRACVVLGPGVATVSSEQAGDETSFARGSVQQGAQSLAEAASGLSFLFAGREACRAVGVPATRLLCDPGLGFQPGSPAWFGALSQTRAIVEAGCVVQVSCVQESAFREVPPFEPAPLSPPAMLGAALFAVHQGARCVRVKDVLTMVRGVRMMEVLLKTAAEQAEMNNV